MTGNAKTPLGLTGASSKDSAAGGRRATTVPHAKPETEPAAVIADWWARAETAWATSDFPKYGSAEWDALDESDPRKLAAMLSAAEKWRRL